MLLPRAQPRRPDAVDHHGRPVADPRVERVAFVVACLATVWMGLCAFWGVDAPFGAGHIAAIAARGVIAENMWQWGILAPVRQYFLEQPPPSNYYAHHPWGIFWASAFFFKLFGREEFICRLPAVLMSTAAPALLYAIGRALWSPVAGALSALAFATLPVALAFANFNGFEPAMAFAVLLITWGTLRFHQTWRRRYMVASLVGVLWGVNADWAVYVFLACIVAGLGIPGLFLPSAWFGGVDRRRLTQWLVLTIGLTLLGGLAYVAAFKHYGQLGDLFHSADMRSSGNDLPLATVLEHREYWIALMFTPLAIAVGKVMAPVFVLRLLVMRRLYDVFPLSLLAMASFEYVYFKQAADVHIFWPHVFAPYYALSVGLLGQGAWRLSGWLVWKLKKRAPGRGPAWVALSVVGLVPLAILPDGITALIYAKHTGSRMNDDGHVIFQDVDKTYALKWLGQRIEGRVQVNLHASMRYTWAQEWALHRAARERKELPKRRDPTSHWILDARFLNGEGQTDLAERYKLTCVGPFWYLREGEPKAPLEAFELRAERPSFFAWYFRAPADPVYRVEPDAFRTWELRHHLGQEAGTPPSAAPATPNERRVAHNAALARGDLALADRLKKEIVAELDTSVATRFVDGSELIGQHHDADLRHELWLYFVASGPGQEGQSFTIRSTIERKKRLSLVHADDKVKGIAGLLEIDPSLWKKGYVYVARAEIRRRPGREVFTGAWNARGPVPAAGGGRIPLMVLD